MMTEPPSVLCAPEGVLPDSGKEAEPDLYYSKEEHAVEGHHPVDEEARHVALNHNAQRFQSCETPTGSGTILSIDHHERNR